MSCPFACMADFDFENPTFDPEGPGIDDDYSFDLPDAIMDPPQRVQQELNTSGELIQSLRGELREAEFEAQKKRLVDTFLQRRNPCLWVAPRQYRLVPVQDRCRRSTGRLAKKISITMAR